MRKSIMNKKRESTIGESIKLVDKKDANNNNNEEAEKKTGPPFGSPKAPTKRLSVREQKLQDSRRLTTTVRKQRSLENRTAVVEHTLHHPLLGGINPLDNIDMSEFAPEAVRRKRTTSMKSSKDGR